MSLTNPNKVITEERLSEFYQGILPYLGGMPEILANKFEKSDIYTTDEKIIGSFLGKPLYQKIFTGTVAAGASSEILFTDIIPDIESLVFYHAKGKRHDMAGYVQIPLINGSGTTMFSAEFRGMGTDTSIGTKSRVTFIAGSGSTSMDYMMILKYTKTTDGTTLIGNDTDYSTTEKIIGTWIDGRPLYQKVIVGTLPNCTTEGTVVASNVNHGITNVDLIFIASAFVKDYADWPATSSMTRILPYTLNSGSQMKVSIGRTQIQYANGAKTMNGSSVYSVAQYTKTTD